MATKFSINSCPRNWNKNKSRQLDIVGDEVTRLQSPHDRRRPAASEPRYLISYNLLHGLLFIITLLVATAYAADWPCWRGPDGLGVSLEKNLPISWSKESNIVWTADIPGKGASSPIVAGAR